MKKTAIILLILSGIILASCGGGSESKWQKNPLDNLIKDLDQVPSYSIILYDMDAEGNFTQTYKHQYKIVTLKDSTPQQEITDWYVVPEAFFLQHQEHMGMEIAAKSEDGQVSKTPAPPGYSNYVGNQRYGRWRDDGRGGSFWEFYGKYMFFSSIFNMATFPTYRHSYMDYRTNYYGRRPYYGSTAGGGRMYGTNSSYTSKTRTNSRWNKSINRNTTFRSTKSTTSGTGVGKTTRSGSRYSSGFSSRSRSGGFGK